MWKRQGPLTLTNIIHTTHLARHVTLNPRSLGDILGPSLCPGDPEDLPHSSLLPPAPLSVSASP